MNRVEQYRDNMAVALTLSILSVIEDSGATQLEAVGALEAAKALLPVAVPILASDSGAEGSAGSVGALPE
jgi:hypothetical protein